MRHSPRVKRGKKVEDSNEILINNKEREAAKILTIDILELDRKNSEKWYLNVLQSTR